MANFYGATNYIGGGTGTVDAIDGNNLAQGDGLFVITTAQVSFHYLNATSGAAEASPTVISPDSNAGDKRWILVAVYATGTLSNIVEDLTPQLGGDLDTNEKDVLIDTGHGINDENDLQQIIFSTTASAVNEITIKNAATGNGPEIRATGDDANIDLELIPKGTGAVNYLDALLKRAKFLDYSETVNALGDLAGGTDDIDITLGNVVTATVSTGAQTFTFSNPSASGNACSFTLILTNGGSETVNWPAAVDWAGGTAPVLTAAGVDVLTFTTVDAGTIWYGFAAGLAMA